MKSKNEVLQEYEKKIVDLSRRNRLLNYPKNARLINFEITLEDFQQKFGVLDEFIIEFPHKELLQEEEKQESLLEEEVIEKNKYVPLTTPKGEKLLSTLSKLRLDAKRKFEEHGLHTLFMTFGRIRWKEPQVSKGSSQAVKGFDYNAPILLVPIQIQEKRNPKQTIITAYLEGSDITINKVVSLLLEKEYNSRPLILNEELLPKLPSLIEDINLQLKTVFEELKLIFEITPEIEIGQYTFYGQQIYEDINKHEEEFLENTFLDSLCTHTPIQQENLDVSTDNLDDFLKPETDFNVLDADTSQLAVIQKVLAGNHLNVQGPPGTGKSQTIVNLAANLLARGKTVLIVCEKQVALEVVFNRLKDKGLDKLCLPLFKYNSDKKTFAKSVIDDRDYISRMVFNVLNLDTPLIDREQHINQLRNYALALGKLVEPLDKTVYWVHGELARNQALTSLASVPWNGNDPLLIKYEDYKKIISLFESITPVYNITLNADHNHWHVVKHEHFSQDFVSRINNILKKIDTLLIEYQNLSLKFFILESVHDLKNYISVSNDVESLKEENLELEENYELYEAHSLLNEGRILAEEYFKISEVSTKKYKIPNSWDSNLLIEFENNIQKEASLSELFEASQKWTDIQEYSRKVKSKLSSIKKADFFEITPIEELLRYKNILEVDPVIIKMKDWKNLTGLQSAVNKLSNLNTIIIRLNEAKDIFDKWGIIHTALDKKKTLDIASNFIKKYNKFWRGLYSQYKEDCNSLKDWCNAKTPQKYYDYLEISNAIDNWFLLTQKFEVLKINFSREHIKKEEVIDNSIIPLLYNNSKKVLDNLIEQKQDAVPNKIVVVVEENENHLYISEVISYFEKIKFVTDSIRKYFQQEELLSSLSFNKIEKIYSNVASIFKALTKIYQNIINTLDESQYPQTVNNLIIDARAIAPLALNLDKIRKLNLEKIYTQGDVISFVINQNESYINLLNNVAKIKNALSIIKTDKKEKITIGDAKDALIEYKKLFPQWQSWIQQYENLLIELRELLSNEEGLAGSEKLTFKDFSKILHAMYEDQEGLGKWMLYRKYERQISDMGYGFFLEESKGKVIENPTALFSLSLWYAWLDKYYKNTPELKNFAVRDHTILINKFRKLEEEIMKINSTRILQKASKEIKEAAWNQAVFDKELVHQSQLKRGHKPIRKLVNSIGRHLIKYKQCWMMSPLTLSSYIPLGTLTFDVVIFDESSQMRVEHALGSIARAKQVVIFGDENQLPPTSFFEVNNEEDEENEEDSNNYESILHATKEILPGAEEILSYHYRSKYEDLITFSNHYIYDDRLITFPNPKQNSAAVEFVYVKNGVFASGETRRNEIEAKKVAELCKEYALTQPNKSLGVIAFSKAQETAIRDELGILLKKYPQLQPVLDEEGEKLEKFFIKNLESVQGDERDIIILSIGYGKDKNGNMFQRFGPIVNSTGFRRLNVAVTRAKEKIICVSSIKATDIVSENKSKGVQLLQKYLDYAEHGRSTITASKLAQNSINVAADSMFEEEVEKELQKAGLVIERQVGASGYKIDLAILDQKKKEYVLGIECDGAQYHSSYSARVNDRIRQENLKRLGWNIYRIWSQHWISNKEQIIDDILNSIS